MRISYSTLSSIVIFISTVISCAGQNQRKQVLLALSKTDHTLAIVDPSTFKVISKVAVGADPHEVIASADGKTAFVSNMGGGRLHEINIIDIPAGKADASFDTGPLLGIHGLAFTGGKLWFTAEGAKAIARYDPETRKTDWILGTGQNRTHMIYVTPDEKHIYTTNVESGTVSMIENTLIPAPVSSTGAHLPGPPAHMDWVQTIVPVAKGSEGFDVSPDGRELWTAASEDGTIWIIDLLSKKVSATINARALGANRLKFTPIGKQVLISSLRSGELLVYDAATRKEIKRINVGHGAAGILMDPNGRRAFVACTPDNYVAIIDLNTWQVNGHLDVGGGPDGLAWAIEK